jgi:hypothetical protein
MTVEDMDRMHLLPPMHLCHNDSQFSNFSKQAGRFCNKWAKESSSDKSNKENKELSTNSMSQPKKKKCMYTGQRMVDEKLFKVFSAIKSIDWLFADFKYYVFQHQDSLSNRLINTQLQYRNFLQGT